MAMCFTPLVETLRMNMAKVSTDSIRPGAGSIIIVLEGLLREMSSHISV